MGITQITEDNKLLLKELYDRNIAHNCPVYAPKQGATDTLYHATRSGLRSAACGDRWMASRKKLKEKGLTPLPQGTDYNKAVLELSKKEVING